MYYILLKKANDYSPAIQETQKVLLLLLFRSFLKRTLNTTSRCQAITPNQTFLLV